MLSSFRFALFRSLPFARSVHSLSPSLVQSGSSSQSPDTSIFDEAFEELKKLEEKEGGEVKVEKEKKKDLKKATAVNAQCETSFKKMNIVGLYFYIFLLFFS